MAFILALLSPNAFINPADYQVWMAKWFADEGFHRETFGAAFCRDFNVNDKKLLSIKDMTTANARIAVKYVH